MFLVSKPEALKCLLRGSVAGLGVPCLPGQPCPPTFASLPAGPQKGDLELDEALCAPTSDFFFLPAIPPPLFSLLCPLFLFPSSQ